MEPTFDPLRCIAVQADTDKKADELAKQLNITKPEVFQKAIQAFEQTLK